MLPAAHRLRSAADFTATTRRGTKVSRGVVVVYLSRSAEPRPARAGVVTSKAIGGSVVRHRAARRIRAAMAPLIDSLPPGSDLVVRALPGADRKPTLAADIRRAVDLAVARSA